MEFSLSQFEDLIQEKKDLEENLKTYNADTLYRNLESLSNSLSSEVEKLERKVNLVENMRTSWEKESLIDKIIKIGLGQENSKRIKDIIERVYNIRLIVEKIKSLIDNEDIDYIQVAEQFVQYHDQYIPIIGEISLLDVDNQNIKQIKDDVEYIDSKKKFISEIFVEKISNTNKETFSQSRDMLKYTPSLGCSKISLEKWSNYAANWIINPKYLEPENEKNARALTSNVVDMYQNTNEFLNSNFNYIRDICGLKEACKFTLDLTTKVHESTVQIYNKFSKLVSMENKIFDIPKLEYPTSDNNEQQGPNHFKFEDIEGIVAFLTYILRNLNMFYSYILVLAKSQGDCDKQLDIGNFVNKIKWGAFFEKIEYHYTSLETYFIRKTAKKALNAKCLTDPKSLETAVDDLFFVLNSFVMRATSTLDIKIISSITTCISNIIEESYKAEAGRIISDICLRKEKINTAMFLACFNYLETGRTYTLKLEETLRSELKKNIGIMYGATPENIDTCCSKINLNFKSITEFKNEWLEYCAKNLIISRIITLWHNRITPCTYLLSQDDLNNGDDSVESFIRSITPFLKWHKDRLLESNYNQIMCLVSAEISEIWRNEIKTKKFTRFGALKLSIDIQQILDIFNSNYAARENFNVIKKISRILNVETLHDLQDITQAINTNEPEYGLTQEEIKKIVSLRYIGLESIRLTYI